MPCVPEVSILLPVFDAEATLPTCLRSITRQTHQRWECIIVDDGSSDSSREVAEKAAAVDRRFRLIGMRHRGLVAALNLGLQQCRGRFIARVDADDWMLRTRLEVQVAALAADAELAGVGSQIRLFPRTHLRNGMRSYEAWLNGMHSERSVRADAFVECPVSHPTLVLRREILSAFGYRDVGWPEDYDLLLRLHRAGHAVAVVPERLLAKRWNSRCLSRRSEAYGADRFLACKASHLADSFLELSDRYVLWGYGQTGRSLRRALAEHGKLPVAIVEVHPRRLGNTIHGAPVIAPDALAEWREHPLVASVSGATARAKIREALRQMGYRELVDFVCAA